MPEIQRLLTTQPKTLPDTKDLAFGRNFTDHWFHCKYSQSKGWHSPTIEPYGSFVLDPAACVLHYGQALFEGMKAYRQTNGQLAIFRPEFNFHRLHAGAERLCLPAPPREIFMKALKELITVEERWVPKEDQCALYVRPTLIGTEPFLGVRPSREAMFFVILCPTGPYFKSQGGLRIWVEDRAVRAVPGGLGDTKAGANYAASLQAAQRAKDRGFDQVLWLDYAHEGIEEVGTMNVFFVFKDEIATPPLDGSILAGNMRDSVLQLLRKDGKNVTERRITVSELLERHANGELLEAFGTGTAAVISSIGELYVKDRSVVLGDRKFGPVSRELYNTISNLQYGRGPDPFGWMLPIASL